MDNTRRGRLLRRTGVISLVVIAMAIGAYLYYLHTGQAQNWIRSIREWGPVGPAVGILIQTATNIFPVPGEFISVILMEIYGPVWGGLFSWCGGILGALCAYFLVNWLARSFFGDLTQPFLQKVELFIRKQGVFGLLLIRFVPFVPYHFVNYAAGLLNVKPWGFAWTTAVGITPYTIAMSGLYAGLRNGSWMWGVCGAGIFVLLAGIGWYARRKGRQL